MEENRSLYWKHFKIWIFGLLFSFPLAGVFGYLFRDKDPGLIIPILIAILSFPFVLHGYYGLSHGFSMSWRYGYIHRDTIAKIWNMIDFGLYIGVVLLMTVIVRSAVP